MLQSSREHFYCFLRSQRNSSLPDSNRARRSPSLALGRCDWLSPNRPGTILNTRRAHFVRASRAEVCRLPDCEPHAQPCRLLAGSNRGGDNLQNPRCSLRSPVGVREVSIVLPIAGEFYDFPVGAVEPVQSPFYLLDGRPLVVGQIFDCVGIPNTTRPRFWLFALVRVFVRDGCPDRSYEPSIFEARGTSVRFARQRRRQSLRGWEGVG